MLRKTKTSLIFAVLFVSIFAAPGLATVNAQSSVPGGWNFSFNSDNPEQLANMPQSLANNLGGLFSVFSQLGPSGAALGQVFSLLFQNIMNMSVQDSLVKGVYTLNATYQSSEIIPGSDFSNNTGSNTYWVYKPLYNESTWGNNQWAYAYFNKTGTADLNHTYGAAIVFIIWDHDGSLITALNKVVSAFHAVKSELEMYGPSDTWTQAQAQEVYNTIVNEVLNAVTYLLIHINDIIDGDELLVTNIITWDTYSLITSPDYQVTQEFKLSSNLGVANPESDPTIDNSNNTITDWYHTAVAHKDNYMIWLTSQVMQSHNLTAATTHWSRFSFNIVELWLKNFQIHINVSAIVNGLTSTLNSQGSDNAFSNMGLAQIFQGLDIEVYLITHSLLGFITFNDTNHNGVPDVVYKDVNDPANNVSSQVPVGSEAKDYFTLGKIDNVVFNEPTKTSDGTGIKWSVRMNNVQMFAVPIGANPQDITPVNESLPYIEMGFTFTPKINDMVNTTGYVNSTQAETVRMGAGIIKLNQYFGQWNGGAGPNDPNLAGLGFSVIFVSTILHFHINFEVQNLSNPNDTSGMYSQQGLLKNSSYYQGEGTIKVGNYAGNLPVAAINIAGPEYVQTTGTDVKTNTTYPAQTCTIPLAFLDFNAKGEVQNVNTQNTQKSFSASGFLNVSASILLYAVSYPTWNGTGDGITHDPTFSVFMTWNSPGFWALILVIGGVTLVGVAAILITKRKNRV